MKKEDIYQILTLVIAITLFIYGNAKTSGENNLLLWGIFLASIIGIIVLYFYYYLKEKLDKIQNNEVEIQKLKDQISFRKSLEEINYRIGKIEGGK